MQITESAEAARIIRAVAPTSSIAVVEARAGVPLQLHLEPGQEVRGEVVGSLVNGRFLVKIAGDLLDMNLPASVRLGESVPLTFLGEKPRLTFALGHEKGNAAVTLSDAGRWMPLLARLPMTQQLSPADVARAIQGSVKGAVVVEAEQGSENAPLNMQTGKQVAAEVVETLPNGRTQVRVAERLLDLNLPRGFTPGSRLQLVFLSDKPQPTFIMLPPPDQKNQAIPPGLRWLSLASALAIAAAPTATEPLIPGSPASGQLPEAGQLSVRLREALGRSGMFYESHLAQWADGKLKLNDLLLEPQGRLSALSQRLNPVQENGSGPDELDRKPIVDPQGKLLHAVPSNELADPQALPQVRQQFALMHTGQFIWQGEAWQGQPLEWKVEEREPEDPDTPGRKWQTEISMELPRLGGVRAELRLQEGRLLVSLHAASAETVAAMREHEQKLRDGYAAAGINVVQVNVAHEEE